MFFRVNIYPRKVVYVQKKQSTPLRRKFTIILKMKFLLLFFGAVFSNFGVGKEEASGLINTFLILRNYGFLRVFVEKAAMGIRS